MARGKDQLDVFLLSWALPTAAAACGSLRDEFALSHIVVSIVGSWNLVGDCCWAYSCCNCVYPLAGRVYPSCSCVVLVGAVEKNTEACCWGRPPLRGYLLQGERVISQREAASTLQKFVAQQIFKSTQFINSWEQILATLHG